MDSSDPTGSTVLLTYTGNGEVAVDSPFAATVIAPLGKIAIGSGSDLVYHGAIYGKDVELRPSVDLVWVPFAGIFPWAQ
ncbi:MAG: hypothetical protein JXX14_06635 [Deltaproteobacteria bacterium]|nr:hypothetical protein [Deltaproteobacteria bacterium]